MDSKSLEATAIDWIEEALRNVPNDLEYNTSSGVITALKRRGANDVFWMYLDVDQYTLVIRGRACDMSVNISFDPVVTDNIKVNKWVVTGINYLEER